MCVSLNQFEPLVRLVFVSSGAENTEPGIMFSTPPTTEEQQAIEDCPTALCAG
jgi:hypothetical protein